MAAIAVKLCFLMALCLLGFIMMPMMFPVTLGGVFITMMFPALVGGWTFNPDDEKD